MSSVEDSLPVLSMLSKACTRYRGNNIWPDKWTNGRTNAADRQTDRQTENIMSSPTLSQTFFAVARKWCWWRRWQ